MEEGYLGKYSRGKIGNTNVKKYDSGLWKVLVHARLKIENQLILEVGNGEFIKA